MRLQASWMEPYATFIRFLAATGLRIGEAIAVQWSDFHGNVLHITRRIYDGEVGTVKSAHSERKLPIAQICLSGCVRSRARSGFSNLAAERPSIRATCSSVTFVRLLRALESQSAAGMI